MKRIAMLLLPVVLWTPLGWAGAALDAPKVADATMSEDGLPVAACPFPRWGRDVGQPFHF